ncbi:MAG: hypothetical protein ACRDPV_03395 [Gaiellaceae bacterium]
MSKGVGLLVSGVLVATLAVVATGCAGGDGSTPSAEPAVQSAPPACPKSSLASWQKLADEIRAPVYCPSWFPQPLVGRFSGRFFNGRSVDPDRSYLVSWAWFESGGGIVQEVHVNLRGYPGTTRIPTCEDTVTVSGKTVDKNVPCFSDRKGRKRLGGETVTVYTANQGADMWHVLYAWRRGGSLYTISQHVAPPYTYEQVVGHMDRMTRTLVRLQPQT